MTDLGAPLTRAWLTSAWFNDAHNLEQADNQSNQSCCFKWETFENEMNSTTDDDDMAAFGHQASDQASDQTSDQASDFDFASQQSTRGPFDGPSLAITTCTHNEEDIFAFQNETSIYPTEDDCPIIAQTLTVSPTLSALHVKPRIRRRKVGMGNKHSLGGRPLTVLLEGELTPIAFTPSMLRTCFGMPLHEAARKLGICATAVKKCCRKMGIKQWPYSKVKPIRTRLTRLASAPMTREIQFEIQHLRAEESKLLSGQGLSCLDPGA